MTPTNFRSLRGPTALSPFADSALPFLARAVAAEETIMRYTSDTTTTMKYATDSTMMITTVHVRKSRCELYRPVSNRPDSNMTPARLTSTAQNSNTLSTVL